MGKDSAYERQWRDLRIRIALFLGGMLVFPVLVVFRVLFAIRLNPTFLNIFVPLIMAEVVGAYCYFVSFKCPRCAELYFQGLVMFRWWPQSRNSDPFTSKCLNCSLPKWSPSSN